MMFQLDVFMLPKVSAANENNLISSYMDFSYKQSKAVLSIGIGNDLVKHMAHQIDPTLSAPSPEIIQDIVCEITNIVGNHLRTYVFNKFNIDLRLSLPRCGVPPDTSVAAINLHFRIRKHDTVKLIFAYPRQLATN
jgi:hypothetical protein